MNFTKSLTLFLALVLSFNTYSRSFYIQPWLGGGVTGTSGSWTINTSTIPASTGGIKLGYSFNRVQLGLGVGLLNTGFILKDLTFAPKYPQTGQYFVKADLTARFNQLFVPVTMGIKIIDAGNFTIGPEIGVAPTYTLRYASKLTYQATGRIEKSVTTDIEKRFSLIGLVAINIVYNLHPKLGVTLTPTYYRMLNDSIALFPATYTYAVTANVGLVLKL